MWMTRLPTEVTRVPSSRHDTPEAEQPASVSEGGVGDQVGNEGELHDHWLCQDKRVEVGTAQAAVDLIQALGERQPGPRNQLSHRRLERTNPLLVCDEPEFLRRLQRVGNVQEVSKHFPKVLERVHGRIRTDEAVLPVVAGPSRIMPLQRLLIGDAFVSEQSAELVAAVGDERKQFAVVVTDLVAKVPKNGPVGLVHALPKRLTVSIVALGQVKGDDPVLVARHDLPLAAGEQVECKSNVAVAHLDRELELVEAEDQPALGGLGNPVLP